MGKKNQVWIIAAHEQELHKLFESQRAAMQNQCIQIS